MALLIKIIKLSATPPTICYPIPLFPILVFSMSGSCNPFCLIRLILFSAVFFSGVNLWNHVNDVEEDKLSGRSSILIENGRVRKMVIIISVLLYIISFGLIVFWALDWRGIFSYILAASATWIYSDRIFLRLKIKRFKRWKDNYKTEILTYLVSIPSFVLVSWSICMQISPTATSFAIATTFYVMSAVVLKDIKDITGDRLAGLRTLAVVFQVETLIKASIVLLTFYGLLICVFTVLSLFPSYSILAVLPLVSLAYVVSHFVSKGWAITMESTKPIKVQVFSGLASLCLLAAARFI